MSTWGKLICQQCLEWKTTKGNNEALPKRGSSKDIKEGMNRIDSEEGVLELGTKSDAGNMMQSAVSDLTIKRIGETKKEEKGRKKGWMGDCMAWLVANIFLLS